MFVMPEVVVQEILQDGIKKLRSNKAAFDELFAQFTQDELANKYGAAYRDEIWVWFTTTKIPVVQAWSFNVTRIPSFSVRSAIESEDQDKAAFSDIAEDNEDGELLTGVLNVNIDIGIHANKSGDHILWMYYIAMWCIYYNKQKATRLGLKLSTFSASDYNREPADMGDNIWTRWIRMKATTQNFLGGMAAFEIDAVNLDPATDLVHASDISTSHDVDWSTLDGTSNRGLYVDSDDEDDVLISVPTVGDNGIDYSDEDLD